MNVICILNNERKKERKKDRQTDRQKAKHTYMHACKQKEIMNERNIERKKEK